MNQLPSPEALNQARDQLLAIRQAVQTVYVGSEEPIDALLVALLAQGHVLLEGVPGVAKTTLVKAFAASLGCSVRRIQFTPDLLPADITGTYVLHPREGTFSLRAGPVFANVVLADEINRAPAKTQSALLEAMQERQVTIEGDRYALPDPFFVLATQNPVDLEGTYPLPEAQIDRFLLRAVMGYPQVADEIAMIKTHGVAPPVVPSLLDAQAVRDLQALAGSVHVDEDLLDYAVRLVTHTRQHRHVLLGASPRASLGLVRAARARAVMSGRGYVTPDDVQRNAVPVLAHRLILVPESAHARGAAAAIVEEALHHVTYRRQARAL
jgi:MoxR-like ATPase